MPCAVELIDALDANRGRSRAVYLRAHGVEQCGQVGDFRFASAVLHDRLTIGQRGGHQQVFGSSHGDFVEDNFSAFEPTAFLRIGGGLDVAVLLRNLRAQALETFDMEIDGAGADGASAGQRDAGAATARDERPQDERRGAHGLDQLIRRFGSGQGAGANRGAVMSSPVAEFYVGAHGGEELACGLDVAHLRNVFENHRFVGEQSRCHARQGGVLRATDADRAE